MDDKLTRKERKTLAALRRNDLKRELLDGLAGFIKAGHKFCDALRFTDETIHSLIRKRPQEKAEILRAARELAETLKARIVAWKLSEVDMVREKQGGER